MTQLGEECAVFGAYNLKQAAYLTYLGLYSLQHRGQESTGIVSYGEDGFSVSKSMGLVSEAYDVETLENNQHYYAIGHNRYSTTGVLSQQNIQPILSQTAKGTLVVSHNGNFTNTLQLSQDLSKQGALFQTTVDSELVLHLVSRSKESHLPLAFVDALAKIEGAFSILALTEEGMIVARDPWGFRPLVMGRIGEGYVFASETCALDLVGATYEREIKAGEVLFVTAKGCQSFMLPAVSRKAYCVFEHVYFARPDSVVFSENVHTVRKKFGAQLFHDAPVKGADLVVSIPDSGNSAALGYANEAGIPFDFGMTRNHYVGRTFIQPKQSLREFGVQVKLNPISEVVKGKCLVVVDDSLVRGTTSMKRVAAFRAAGAKEVHLRIAAPPVSHTCYFGVDLPDRQQLIAAQKSLDEICEYIQADSLGFLSVEGMLSVLDAYAPKDYCAACFDGCYPLAVKDKNKYSLDQQFQSL